MTDLEKMKNTFNDLGVVFIETTAKEEQSTNIATLAHDGEVKFNICLSIDNGIGYYGFNCDFYFLDGKYQNHGCWE